MVAGSTGSGKSELLISLIMGLAVNYAPSVLNFVLIDYKGGGAFKELYDLPHVVDLVTNIQRDGVTRMFTAINAEMIARVSRPEASPPKLIPALDMFRPVGPSWLPVDYRNTGTST